MRVLAVGGALSRGTAVGKPVASVLIGHRCQTSADTDRRAGRREASRCLLADVLMTLWHLSVATKCCCEQSDNLVNNGCKLGDLIGGCAESVWSSIFPPF